MINFSLFANDPFYRLLSKLGLTNKNGKPKLLLTILIIFVLTWLIPAILASLQGVAINPSPQISYFYDFAAYSQFFLAIPLLFLAEPYVDGEIEWGINHLYLSHLLTNEDRHNLENKLNKASKDQALVLISMLLLIIAFIMGVLYAFGEFSNGISNWHSLVTTFYTTGKFENPTWAGWWNALISQTFLVYFLLRWVWKIAIWYRVIWQISRCKLRLHAAHPDLFGGLGFFLSIQSRFTLLILAVGLTMAATNAYKIWIEKETVALFSTTGLGALLYFIVAPLLFLAPLLFFSPALSNTKRQSLLKYSALAMKKSIIIDNLLSDEGYSTDETATMDEQVLTDIKNIDRKGSSEIIQAMKNLASVNDYYESIRKMHTIPVDFQRTGRMFVAGLGPLIPLFIQSTVFTTIYEILKGKSILP